MTTVQQPTPTPTSNLHTSSQQVKFTLPAFTENTVSWGPASTVFPEHLSGLPFMPFNRSERLTRISDWIYVRDGRGAAAGLEMGPRITEEEDVNLAEDEGGAFSLVDNKPKTKPRFGYRPFIPNRRTGPAAAGQRRTNTAPGNKSQPGSNASNIPATSTTTQQKNNYNVGYGGRRAPPQQGRQNNPNQRGNPRGNQRRYGYEQKEAKESSVPINEKWTVVDTIELSDLSGVTFDPVSQEDILFAGKLDSFNPMFARVHPRNPVQLQRFENVQYFAASTSEDPILQRLWEEDAGHVFATDSILSALMAAPKSVYSWDILVRKEGNKIMLDKRPRSKLDYLSVNENSNEILDKEALAAREDLSLEATVVQHNFSKQVLIQPSQPGPQPIVFSEPNPFLESLTPGNEPASVGFRYRKWDIGHGVYLVARTSLNGYVEKRSTTTAADSDDESNVSYVLTRVLNEYDPKVSKVDWKQKLEAQTGAVLAIEMKNNGYKLMRFVAEAALAGADELRLGFVTRSNVRNSFKHQILMTKQYTTSAFADSVSVRLRSLWGTLKVLLDRIRDKPDGHYLLMRDPNAASLVLYQVPAAAFSDELESNAAAGSHE